MTTDKAGRVHSRGDAQAHVAAAHAGRGRNPLLRITLYSFRHPWQAAAAIGATIIASVLQLMIPRLLGQAVDQVGEGVDAAGGQEAMVWAMASGEETGQWEEAVSKAASPYALSAPKTLSLSAAVSKPLQFPQQQHIFLADSDAAGLMLGLYRGLSGAGLAHSVYLGEGELKVYLAGGVPGYEARLFDALNATTALIDGGLKLKKEAGCLQASVGNVLASGWRARDMDIEGNAVGDDQIAALLGEQIDLAGSLMQRFPG